MDDGEDKRIDMLFHAVGLAQRRFVLFDFSVGDFELTEALNNALRSELGDAGYLYWVRTFDHRDFSNSRRRKLQLVGAS